MDDGVNGQTVAAQPWQRELHLPGRKAPYQPSLHVPSAQEQFRAAPVAQWIGDVDKALHGRSRSPWACRVAATCAPSADEAESLPAAGGDEPCVRSRAAGARALLTQDRLRPASLPRARPGRSAQLRRLRRRPGRSGGAAASRRPGPGSGRPGLGHLGAGDRFVVLGSAWDGQIGDGSAQDDRAAEEVDPLALAPPLAVDALDQQGAQDA